MSKVSDFIAAYREQQKPKDQTVAEYAEELKKPIDSFMQQLAEAGIQKKSSDEILTDEDKSQLLTHLRTAHRPRGRRASRTITIDHEINKFLRTVAAQDNGAEWELLERFAADVVWGNSIGGNVGQGAWSMQDAIPGSHVVVVGQLIVIRRSRAHTRHNDKAWSPADFNIDGRSGCRSRSSSGTGDVGIGDVAKLWNCHHRQ